MNPGKNPVQTLELAQLGTLSLKCEPTPSAASALPSERLWLLFIECLVSLHKGKEPDGIDCVQGIFWALQ